MALVVENGEGLPNAESYIDVDFADAYFLKRGNETWDAIVDKESKIILAMDYIENNYSFIGIPLKETQALKFPRVVDEVTIYPINLKNAVCELALRANTESLLQDSGKTTIREKLGDLEVEYDTNQANKTYYNYVDLLLSQYVASTSQYSHKVLRG